MLTVKTFLKEAGPKGIGLFALEPIPNGTIWWRDDAAFNRVIPKHQADKLPSVAQAFVKTYGTLNDSEGWYICLDNARFVNHSDRPNTMQVNGGGIGSSGDWITTKDIAAGEEITSDYTQFCATCTNGLPFKNEE